MVLQMAVITTLLVLICLPHGEEAATPQLGIWSRFLTTMLITHM